MRQRPDDGIQNLIEALANIFAQKPQHMISVLLEQPGAEHPCAGHVGTPRHQPGVEHHPVRLLFGILRSVSPLPFGPSRRKESAILH